MAFKIVYDKKNCIGAGTCGTISKHLWHVGPDGTATLKGATVNPSTGAYELELDESHSSKEHAVAGNCPAGCITIHQI